MLAPGTGSCKPLSASGASDWMPMQHESSLQPGRVLMTSICHASCSMSCSWHLVVCAMASLPRHSSILLWLSIPGGPCPPSALPAGPFAGISTSSQVISLLCKPVHPIRQPNHYHQCWQLAILKMMQSLVMRGCASTPCAAAWRCMWGVPCGRRCPGQSEYACLKRCGDAFDRRLRSFANDEC